MAETKYGHLVKKMNFEEGTGKTEGTGNSDYLAWPKGSDLERINMNFAWEYFSRTGEWFPGTTTGHTHAANECLSFVSLDYDNPNYLGAEIEIQMGEEREVHVFDTPTVVVAPKGLVHCPLITRRVDKPYSFSAICLNTEHDTTFLG